LLFEKIAANANSVGKGGLALGNLLLGPLH
jgi:hypothetical protein